MNINLFQLCKLTQNNYMSIVLNNNANNCH